MSVAKKDIYQLVDGMLDRGLPYVGSYLEKRIGQQIFVTDCRGFIHYPDISSTIKQLDHSFISLPTLTKNDYLYSETENCLYYRIICGNSSAYILVKNLPPTLVSQVLSTLKQSKLAIKCYFSQMNQTTKDPGRFEQELYEYLFGESKANLTDILTLSDYSMASDCRYSVDIMRGKNVKSSRQWSTIMSYSREFLKRVAPEAFIVGWAQLGIAVYIIPDGQKTVNIELFKTALEKNDPVTVSFGRGNPHPLCHLRRSCDEARIALHYPHAIGTTAEIQSFSELGTFTPLFSQDLEAVKLFCKKTLEPLYDHDRKNEGSLVLTLTELINSNFILKETAKNLYIHVNTLYYRIKKIEQLLHVDLSLLSTRFNLYTALISWSVLDKSGLW